MSVQIIKDRNGKPEYVLLPIPVYKVLQSKIDEQLAALGIDDEANDEYEPFDPADYIDNPVAIDRMRAGVKQKELAQAMDVSQAYISKLEAADHITPAALKRVRTALNSLKR